MRLDKLPSDCIMSASSVLSSVTVTESPLHIKMGFLRKYFGIIAAQSILISLLSSVIMLSPIARFYITENDWVLFAVCFLFFATYFSLFHLIKMTVIDILLLLHIGVQALTIGVIVTYYDLMFLLQAILLSTWTIFVIFLYTLQSKRDCNIWVILVISSICIISASALLRAVFGGTNEENILSVLITVLFLIYQTYSVFTICKILTPADCILAVVNMHLLPINVLVFSTAVNKPPR